MSPEVGNGPSTQDQAVQLHWRYRLMSSWVHKPTITAQSNRACGLPCEPSQSVTRVLCWVVFGYWSDYSQQLLTCHPPLFKRLPLAAPCYPYGARCSMFPSLAAKLLVHSMSTSLSAPCPSFLFSIRCSPWLLYDSRRRPLQDTICRGPFTATWANQ